MGFSTPRANTIAPTMVVIAAKRARCRLVYVTLARRAQDRLRQRRDVIGQGPANLGAVMFRFRPPVPQRRSLPPDDRGAHGKHNVGPVR